VAGPVGVDQRNVEVGTIKRRVIVAAVPQDDVGFLLGLADDHFVIDARVDDNAIVDMGLVFLALFDRAAVAIEVLVGLETLAGLLGEVTVGHRVTDRHHPLTHSLEKARYVPRCLRFTDAGAHSGDGDDRFGRLDHCLGGRAHTEMRPPADHLGSLVHDVGVGNVRVAEPHLVDAILLDHFFEVGLGKDRNAVRVERTGEFSGIGPVFDIWDLGGGKHHHLVVLVVAEQTVEIVEVASSRTHDDDLGPCHEFPPRETVERAPCPDGRTAG
jgi:hypothetical protein